MKKVVLILPPMPQVEATKKEALVDELKAKAYSLWQESLKRRFGPATDLHKVLPARVHAISIGILSLCTYLKERGIQVEYLHCDYLLSKGLAARTDLPEYAAARVRGADLCGIYSTTPLIQSALQIAEAIKRASPETLVVLGGPHVTFADLDTLEGCPAVDLAVRGEGEETLYQIICSADQQGGVPAGLPGTTFRSGGRAVRALEREFLPAPTIPAPDFSVLPKDYDLLLIDMYARGCPFRCRFCAEGAVWKQQVRFRDPRTVAGELDYIRRNYNQDLIHLADSEIDMSSGKLEQLLAELEPLDNGCRYTVNLRPDAYKRISPSLLKRLRRAGFVGFFIGVESGSDLMLERMGRASTYADFLKTLDLLNAEPDKIVIPYLMLGFPGETATTLQETQDKFLALLEEERISFLFPKFFIPYPGTEPFQNPEKYGLQLSKRWKDYSRFGFPPPFTAAELPHKVLGASITVFYERIFDVLHRGSIRRAV